MKPPQKPKNILSYLGPLIALTLFCAAGWLLYKTLHKHSWADFMDAIQAIPYKNILYAFLFTAGSYLVLAGYDFSALYYINRRIKTLKVFMASFIGFAFSQNLGLSPLTGGSVRLRLYTASGLSPMEVAKVVAFCILTFSIGSTAICGLILFLMPEALQPIDHLPIIASQIIGAVTFLSVVAYVVWVGYRKKPIIFKGFEFNPPSAMLSIWQVLLAAADVGFAAAVLYVLLPDSNVVSYYYFFAIYLIAYTLGILSHVPGGLGIFEVVIITLLADKLPEPSIVGALLLFRIIYLFVPLVLAALALLAYEALHGRTKKESQA